MDDHDKLIIIVVTSVVGGLLLLVVISLAIWCILRQRSQRSILPRYRHPLSSNRRSTRRSETTKRRFNTTDSSISITFDPPHLINQNVKNLDRLLASESTLTAKSWHYKESNSTSNQPTHSPSTVSTSISDLAHALQTYQQSHNQAFDRSHHRFLHELDHILRFKQDPRTVLTLDSTRIDQYPSDYSFSFTPSILTTSEDQSFEPTPLPWTDDSAILY